MSESTTPVARLRRLVSRISRLEWICLAVIVVVFVVLVVLEPDIVEAPWQSERAIAVVVGGTFLAAVALFAMLHFGVPPVVRVLVLGAPLAATSYWLISPFFTDTVVRERFDTSIAAARAQAEPSTTTAPAENTASTVPSTTHTTAPTAPQLLGTGEIVGLAGHSGTGDAAIFRLPDGALVVRLENLDIDNGPDLQLYLVPGADRRRPSGDSHHFGALRGNIGDQTYDIPRDFAVGAGPWTVLVWCRAFAVEFVAATFTVA